MEFLWFSFFLFAFVLRDDRPCSKGGGPGVSWTSPKVTLVKSAKEKPSIDSTASSCESYSQAVVRQAVVAGGAGAGEAKVEAGKGSLASRNIRVMFNLLGL